MLYRIRIRGGGGSEGGGGGRKKLDEILAEFASKRNIDRSVLPEVPSLDPTFLWLSEHVKAHLSFDTAHFLQNIRTALRKRQMTIELGGVNDTEPLAIGIVALDPLPEGADLSGPDLKHKRVERILKAPDVAEQEVHKLYGKMAKLTPEEKDVVERHQIRKAYKPGGPLTFEELVEQDVEKKFGDKVRLAAFVLPAEASVAAGIDEAELRFGAGGSSRIRQRQLFRDMLSTFPGFNPDMLTRKDTYRISRERLEAEQEDILKRQEAIMKADEAKVLPLASTAQDGIKRIVSHFNKVLRAVGHPIMTPSKFVYPNETKVASEWKLKGASAPVLYYAGVAVVERPQPQQQQQELVEIEHPIVFATHVTHPRTLERYMLQSPDPDMLMIHVPWESARLRDPTFVHSLRTVAGLQQDIFISVTDAVFHRGRRVRIAFPQHVKKQLLAVLQGIFHEEPLVAPLPLSNEPLPRLSTWCRVPRIVLARVGEGLWTIHADTSEYFLK
jgi:hypothetical protein